MGSGGGGGHPKPAPAAVVTITPETGTKSVSPADPIVVKADHGKLSEVTLTNASGKHIEGDLSADETMWTASEKLGYSKSYELSATATNPDGKKVSDKSSFSTVKPGNYTLPYLQNTEGQTYGVGEPVMVHFDEAIPDRAAAEKSLKVTTEPSLEGAWHWINDQDVHWRPKTDAGAYWPANTKVSVKADVYGVNMGKGLWGQEDRSVSFNIGDKRVAIGTNKSLHMKVYENDKQVRDMPFSGGLNQYIQDKYGNSVPLSTPSGTMVIMAQERRVHMTSASWGIAKGNPMAYDSWVDFGSRLTGDGIYLHSADWNVSLHGVRNDSHGCINLDPDDAKWTFDNLAPGDIVIMKGTSQKVGLTRGYGDWNLSWDQWLAGSALH
ncbi:MAG: Ig-like domain-containing protein [Actinocatenispora sp.]